LNRGHSDYDSFRALNKLLPPTTTLTQNPKKYPLNTSFSVIDMLFLLTDVQRRTKFLGNRRVTGIKKA
jgi:hypothetical protein